MHHFKEIRWAIIDIFFTSEKRQLEASYLIEKFDIKTRVTSGYIFEEIANHQCFVSLSDQTERTADDFKQGWVVAAEKGNPLPNYSKDYVAFNVVSSEGKRLSRCKMT